MKAILHADKKWGIGKKNTLMFSLKKDMRFFKETTTGKVVCMGYNTLLSFPNGKPLKNRVNIVLCPEGVERDDLTCVHSLEELKTALKSYDDNDVYIIGGATFYKTMLPYCSHVLVTKVNADGGAEVFFENLDENENFVLESESEPMDDNGYTVKFCTYKNLKTLPF